MFVAPKHALAFGLVLVLALPGELAAQSPFLVKDINPTANIAGVAAVNGTLFLSVGDAAGHELWKSDGSGAGTVLVKDINPGSASSNPSQFASANGLLYFTAADPATGYELWKSDGTSAGTVLVKDIEPGPSSSSPWNLVTVNGTLYFDASTSSTGEELWKSDGTSAGTVLVKDIRLGTASSAPINLTAIGASLLFHAYTTTSGYELWKSDGTDAGTVLVKDIAPGSPSSASYGITLLSGTAYFAATDGASGFELWKSDGTTVGTALVLDIAAGSPDSWPGYLTTSAGVLYFQASDGVTGVELWRSDGTPGGTDLVNDLMPGSFDSSPSHLTDVGGTLFFTADDGTLGEELWKSDGTAAGTLLVKDIWPGSSSSGCTSLVDLNGMLVLAADDGVVGKELWRSDGTGTGTVLIKDIAPAGGSSPGELTYLNGVLYLSAREGAKDQLWRTTGMGAGTVLIKDFPSSSSSLPSNLASMNGATYFSADDGAVGTELWKSDGTQAGTVLVKDIREGAGFSNPSNLTNVAGSLFFGAISTGWDLWKSDGTGAGTVMVQDLPSGSNPPRGFTNVSGTIYFVAGGTIGDELWKTDGTAAGTELVKDIRPGSVGSVPRSLTSVNGTLFFVADDGTNGFELWKSDGTAAGTALVKDIYAGSSGSNPGGLAVLHGVLYMFANDGATGIELWKSDGTAAGTTLVKDIYPGAQSTTSNLSFVELNGSLYFRAGDPTAGGELWKTDGTSAGTTLVKEIYPGGFGSLPSSFTAANGAFYFLANDGSTGNELWKSNGTAAGTVLVKDLTPGSASSTLQNLTNGSGTLYFTADNGSAGRELWKSDGTAAGTVQVGDIFSGASSSNPSYLTLACPNLFFAATSGSVGRELFAVQIPGAGGPSYADIDGDGYGSGPPADVCLGTPGYVANNTDCDDRDPSVHPGASETICNGVDNNCNGTVDEGVACVCVANGPGLAGWWRGNSNANDSAGGNNGTLSAAGAGYVLGKVGQAFSLRGGYVANLGDASSFSFIENTGVFTIDAWINIWNADALAQQAITASTVTTIEKGHFFLWENSAGKQRLRMGLMKGIDSVPIIDASSPDHVITNDSDWHHVAVVGDGTNVMFYVDGVGYPGTGTMGSKPSGASSRPVDIGRCPSATPQCMFDGAIDEVQIYDRSLSAAEIRAIYNAGSAGMCGTGCAQSVAGLVGWWPGSGDGNDRSSYNQNGGLPSMSFAPGKVGQAFSLNGSTTYMGIGNAPHLTLTSQCTMEAWIKPNDVSSNQQILSKWSYNPGNFSYQMNVQPGGSLRMDISGDGSTYVGGTVISPGGLLSVGTWSHVAATFDAGIQKLYVNGTLVATHTSAFASIYPGSELLYMGIGGGGIQFFNGLIDEPKVFNRALTAHEIKGIYDAGSSGMCGLGMVTGVDEPIEAMPSFRLSAPRPNPARRSTSIHFRTPATGTVHANVFDASGRLVARLIDGLSLPAGEHDVTWGRRDGSGRRVAAGVYFVRVTAGSAVAVRKVVLID